LLEARERRIPEKREKSKRAEEKKEQ